MLTSAPRPSSPALPYFFKPETILADMVSEQSLILGSPPPAPISKLKPRDQCPRWLEDSDCSLGHMLLNPRVWTYALLKTKMRSTSMIGARVRGGGGCCFGGLGKKCIHCYQKIHPPPANDQAVCRVKDY